MRRFVPAAAVLACLGLAGVAAAVGQNQVHVGVNASGRVEAAKTIPISGHAWRKPRVVASLSPSQLGAVHDGDTVSGFAEAELSVTCLERSPQCVGSIYHYSPHVKARLVLGETPHSTGGTEIGRTARYQCSQDLPNRNHHCVVAVTRTAHVDGDPGCQGCHLNLVVSAYHSSAGGGDRVVVGTDGDGGINQGKASISGAVFGSSPASFSDRKVMSSHGVVDHRIPVAAHNASHSRRVLLSVRLDNLRAGESLMVDAKAHVGISRLGYSTLMQSQLILSRKRGSTSRSGAPIAVASWDGKGDAQNGFNCTQGHSGYPNPCPIHKVGAIRIQKDATTHPSRGTGPHIPLYLNLVTGAQAEYQRQRHWHPGDFAVTQGGKMRVWRYPAAYHG
jgi:hypothetical protein